MNGESERKIEIERERGKHREKYRNKIIETKYRQRKVQRREPQKKVNPNSKTPLIIIDFHKECFFVYASKPLKLNKIIKVIHIFASFRQLSEKQVQSKCKREREREELKEKS